MLAFAHPVFQRPRCRQSRTLSRQARYTGSGCQSPNVPVVISVLEGDSFLRIQQHFKVRDLGTTVSRGLASRSLTATSCPAFCAQPKHQYSSLILCTFWHPRAAWTGFLQPLHECLAAVAGDSSSHAQQGSCRLATSISRLEPGTELRNVGVTSKEGLRVKLRTGDCVDCIAGRAKKVRRNTRCCCR